MTALHEQLNKPKLPGLDHLLTVEEYAALGETESGYTELVEGRLLVSPSPMPVHNIASGELFIQLKQQIPDHLQVIQDIDIDLELLPHGSPGFSRRPDLVIVGKEAVRRVGKEGGMLRASEVLVVIEIVSPGSKRTDYVAKRGEYADAGIPHYWIVDITEPVSLVAFHLTEEFGYSDSAEVTESFTTSEPFAVKVDLDELL